MKPLFNCFVLMLLSALCASCNRSHEGYVDERSPVDVSDIISMIESGESDSLFWIMVSHPDSGTIHLLTETEWQLGDIPFPIKGKCPFLDVAEDYFNIFAFFNAISCDYECLQRFEDLREQLEKDSIDEEFKLVASVVRTESETDEYLNSEEGKQFVRMCLEYNKFPVWLDLDPDNTVVPAISAVDTRSFRTDSILQYAEDLKRSVVADLSGEEYDGWGQFGDFIAYNVMNLSYYLSCTTAEYRDKLQSEYDAFSVQKERVLKQSLESLYFESNDTVSSCDSLEACLKLVADCSSYEEQCALVLSLTPLLKRSKSDSPYSYIALLDKMITSGHYSKWNVSLWSLWRCLYQINFDGHSKDSRIPNDYYNSRRKICYMTYLRHLANFPEDIVAINQAAITANSTNIMRYGEFQGGNQVIFEEMEWLY